MSDQPKHARDAALPPHRAKDFDSHSLHIVPHCLVDLQPGAHTGAVRRKEPRDATAAMHPPPVLTVPKPPDPSCHELPSGRFKIRISAQNIGGGGRDAALSAGTRASAKPGLSAPHARPPAPVAPAAQCAPSAGICQSDSSASSLSLKLGVPVLPDTSPEPGDAGWCPSDAGCDDPPEWCWWGTVVSG